MEEETKDNEVTVKNNGIWTNNLLNIPELIATYMKVWLEDSVPEDLLAGMKESKGKYTEEAQKAKIEEVYGDIISRRKGEFEQMLKLQEENSKNNG